MLHKFKNAYWVILLLIVVSCEEVIEIDLNTSNPVFVAEAVIEKDSTAWIQLSYSSDYFSNDESEKITEAQVYLDDENGNKEMLTQIGDGYYSGSELIGTEESNYTMSVQIGDETYTATTSINKPSEIVLVNFEETEMRREGEGGAYGITVTFTDDSETNNFYMVKFVVNDILETGTYNLIDNSFYDSSGLIEYTPMRSSFELNDEVEVLLYSIDEDAHTYYSQLNDIGGDNMMGSSTPYNPKSNFGEEFMGYFAGWSVTSYLTKVAE